MNKEVSENNETNKNRITKECKSFVKERYLKKFKNFTKALKEYNAIEAFAPDGNIWESGQSISEEAHYVMRLASQYHLNECFKAMKIDLNNPNVKEELEVGNIGTPGRIAKVWNGASVDDDREIGNGRWNKPVRIATFPNTSEVKIPITKRVDIISSCSHHAIVFDTISRPDSYAFISYIPDQKVLGISKLQRLASNVSSRFFLQEDLVKALYEKVSAVAGTESVFVSIVNARHGCETYRSTRSKDGSFSSEYYGGDFNDSELRKQVYRTL